MTKNMNESALQQLYSSANELSSALAKFGPTQGAKAQARQAVSALDPVTQQLLELHKNLANQFEEALLGEFGSAPSQAHDGDDELSELQRSKQTESADLPPLSAVIRTKLARAAILVKAAGDDDLSGWLLEQLDRCVVAERAGDDGVLP